MAARIVLFGATGYTGRLTAEALVARGAAPVLAGRDAGKLEALAGELGGGLETQVADVAVPASVRRMVEPGDILVSTVGPFVDFGEPAVRAAIEAHAHYLDSTGEPAFIRSVFERFGPQADAAGVGLVTAFGFDFVPGNLAGGLAMQQAGDAGTSLDIGYFISRDTRPSGGTAATSTRIAMSPAVTFRDGELRTERMAARVGTFDVDGRRLRGVSLGASEHFALPRTYPSLRTVDVYLGRMSGGARAAQTLSAVSAGPFKIPGVRSAVTALAGRLLKGSTGGPDAEARSKTAFLAAARATADSGRVLATVALHGPDVYTFTGDILAWGAMEAAANGLRGAGALGPVDAFGLDALRAGVESCGVRVLA